jgi:hypothetical protein
MKKLYCIVLLMSCSHLLHAQTANEWIQQKKTQIKYLLEQIAALKVYTGYLQKGYSIAKEGLNTINDIKHGDFFIHEGHFDSLKIVNPAISESFYVADAIVLAEKINAAAKAGLLQARQSTYFTEAEKQYVQWVYDHIMEAAAADIDQLTILITDGELQMKDDERLKSAEVIYTSVQEKYAFVKSFSKQAQLLSIQRNLRQSETNKVKKLYNIK